ncbi:MAG TPA: hypothetical protein VG796_23855 [Verrucomicrobiales bacterium]|nr:hypothetical protein [Verrucomicrobiales bacterium]
MAAQRFHCAFHRGHAFAGFDLPQPVAEKLPCCGRIRLFVKLGKASLTSPARSVARLRVKMFSKFLQPLRTHIFRSLQPEVFRAGEHVTARRPQLTVFGFPHLVHYVVQHFADTWKRSKTTSALRQFLRGGSLIGGTHAHDDGLHLCALLYRQGTQKLARALRPESVRMLP